MSDRSNIIDTIAKHDMFSTFTRLMETSGANDVFKNEGPFTVFAPTNDAFAKIPDATFNELLQETGQVKLKALLSYHILPGKVMAANMISSPTRKAFSGEELMFTDVNGLKVNRASIQARNLEATNGVVHALDTVLTPTRHASAASTGPLVTPSANGSRTPTAVPNTSAASATSASNGSTVLSANKEAATPASSKGDKSSIL